MAKMSRRGYERLARVLSGPLCSICGELLTGPPFCNKCGSPNPHFSHADFEVSHGSLEEMLKDCQAGHPEALRAAREERDLWTGTEYCSFCGEDVFRPENLDG